MAAMPASPEELPPLCEATATAPSMASRSGMLSRCARSTLRRTCAWVTWATSWAITPATSSSVSAASTRPAFVPM